MDGEFYNELRNSSKDYTDRYKNCKILEDKVTGETFLSMRESVDIPTKSSDVYHIVQSHESMRLDLLAHQYYRNPLLWWVIAQANNIYNPMMSIEAGTILRIPSLETLYGNDGVLL